MTNVTRKGRGRGGGSGDGKGRAQSFCWSCSQEVPEDDACLGCSMCEKWICGKCVNFHQVTIDEITNPPNVTIEAFCPACNKKRNGKIEILLTDMMRNIRGEINEEVSKMWLSMEEKIENLTALLMGMTDTVSNMAKEIDELKKENTDLKHDKYELKKLVLNLKEVRDSIVCQNVTSYANAAKNALIVNSNMGSIDEKKESISKVLETIPIDNVRTTNRGALVMNFQTKVDLQKAKDAIHTSGIETKTKIGSNLDPKVMVTYVRDDENMNIENKEELENYKENVIDPIKRKNEKIKSAITSAEDLSVVRVRNAKQYFKHIVLKCKPHIRKIIYDSGDKVYMESKIHSVYDSYHVIICNFCQKFGHKEEKCEDK